VELQGESHSGFTHLEVEVEKAELEVKTVTPNEGEKNTRNGG